MAEVLRPPSATPQLKSPSESPIRVLLVAPAEGVGGQARAAEDIRQGFAGHRRIDVRLQAITPHFPGRLRRLTELKGIRTLLRPIVYVTQLLREIPRADVVQVFCTAHFAFLLGALPAILIARGFRKKIIVHYHDGRAASHLRLWGPVARWGLRLGDRLVVPSGYLKEIFSSAGLTADVVPNVVDTEAFQYRDPVPSQRRLVSTRTLEKLYAVDNTLAAFRLLKAEFPDLILDIYGSGPAADTLRRLVETWGLNDVTFHGGIAHAQMPAALAAGGIMLNSSRVDNMPHFVIEAFAAGTPVVTTQAGGIPYVVHDGQTGLLVPLDDPPALARAVRRLLETPELALELARAARQQCEYYTWASAAKSWEALYLGLGGAGEGGAT